MSNQLLSNLRDANPIPHPDRLLTDEAEARVFLATVQERRHGMANSTQPEAQLTEAPPPPPKPRRDGEAVISVVRGSRRRFVYELAAAVAVLIVGTVTWIAFLNDGEPDLAAPVDIGRSFLEAQDAFDAEAVVALIAPEGVVNDGFGFVNQVEEYPSHLAWNEAMGWRLTVEECTETASGPPAQVACTYAYENAWTQALGRPVSLNSYRFVIANGQIQEVSTEFGPGGFLVDAWLQFREWVRDNHPEDLAVMYDFSNPADDVPIVTPEALVLWEQYTNEFVAFAGTDEYRGRSTDFSTP